MDLRNARILVTGGAGFIGSALCLRLVARGARVRATWHDRQPGISASDIQFIRADLRRPEDCARVVVDTDYVFHCAAETAGASVMVRTPLAQVTPNVLMNTQLLEAAHAAGVRRFLFLSSGAAYPDRGAHPMREHEMFDGDPLDVYFAVGWMKRYTEILCRTYAEKMHQPMPCVVVRPSNVYGPLDKFDPERSHVTASIIRRVAGRENPMAMWGTGTEVRDLIYIDDFLDGMLAAFAHDAPFLAVNIAAGTGYTVREILETAIACAGLENVDVSFDTTKPTTASIRLLDTSLAHQLFGFKAGTTLADGLSATLAWYCQGISGRSGSASVRGN